MKFKEFINDLGSGIKEPFIGERNKDNLFSLNGKVPLKNALPFGLQHILAMFASNVAPLLIVFSAIGIIGTDLAINSLLGALLISGIGTIVQLLIGARLPVVIGTSFTFVPILITIGLGCNGAEEAYYTIVTSIIAGGGIASIFSLFYKWWGRLIKPIVPAIVVMGIGMSLLASGAMQFFGGERVIASVLETGSTGSSVPYFAYIIVAFVTLISALAWQIFAKGVWKNISIVVGIVIGYVVSCFIPGMIDFSGLKVDTNALFGAHGIFALPKIIEFGKLEFKLVPIVLTTVCFIVAIIEAIGDVEVLASEGLGRDASNREIAGALFFDGLNSTVGALFGALPLTTYAQNVGIVSQTKVVNRFTLFIGALFLVIASLFPPVANFIYTIPDCVIGGTMVIVFGSIVVMGIKMISENGWSDKNILIVGISMTLGFGLTIAHISLNDGSTFFITKIFSEMGLNWLSDLLSNNVLNMFVISIILSWVLPDTMHIDLFHKKKETNE